MIRLYFLLLIFQLIKRGESVWFCSATCNKNACTDAAFDKCTVCPVGLVKDTTNATSSCVAATYVNTSTSPKYTVIGKSDDITYDLKNTTTVVSLQSSNAPVSTCVNSSYNYQYYGNFFNSDVI